MKKLLYCIVPILIIMSLFIVSCEKPTPSPVTDIISEEAFAVYSEHLDALLGKDYITLTDEDTILSLKEAFNTMSEEYRTANNISDDYIALLELMLDELEDIVISNKVQTYTGQELGVDVALSNETFNLTVTYSDTPVNAGLYDVDVVISKNNLSAKIESTLTIEKAQSVITAESVQQKVYNSGVQDLIASLNHSESSLSYSPAKGYINAGAYNITISVAESDNYLAATSNVQLVISPKPLTVIYNGIDDLHYDGNELVVSAEVDNTEVYINDDLGFDFVVSNDVINVGIYTITSSITNSNYVLVNDSVTFNVNKTTPNITADDMVVTYDGNAHSINASIDNDGDLSITYNGSTELPVNAGVYTVIISYTGDINFNSVSTEVTLTIEKAQSLISSDLTQEFVYDGSVKNVVAL